MLPSLLNEHLLAGRTADGGVWIRRPAGGDPSHAVCTLDAGLRCAAGVWAHRKRMDDEWDSW